MTTASSAADEVATLREAMVRDLQEAGDLRSEEVARAIRTVPRHLFVPEGFTPADAYHPNKALVAQRDARGVATSYTSSMHIQVTQLEQAEIEPGMSVLEVGSGGVNAAYCAELAGETGHVVTLDIDPFIVNQARNCLAAAGYADRVEVVEGDGAHGFPGAAPFDRIIVTTGAWDVPPAWREQLAPGGRIVVPLRMRGMTRSVALEPDGDHLTSTDCRLVAFVPMQGENAREERLVPLSGSEVALRLEDDVTVDVDGLQAALRGDRVERWTGVEFDDPPNTHLWLATAAPETGILAARKPAIESGLVAPSAGQGVPTLIRGSSLAYRTKRRMGNEPDRFEHVVFAHGPAADEVAEEYVELLRTFERDLRGGPGPRIEVFGAKTPTSELPEGCVIDKRSTRVVVSWPGARRP